MDIKCQLSDSALSRYFQKYIQNFLKSDPGDNERAVGDAIAIGYRHIDTAYFYKNEKEVGNAVRTKIAEGLIKREDIFVTTKLWSTFHEPGYVEKAFKRSFDNLNLTYIDLYLIHYPVPFQRLLKNDSFSVNDVSSFQLSPVDENGNTLTADVDYLIVWHAMEKLVESGQVRSIGLSNFNSEQTERVLSNSKIKPVTNQVECHPNLNQRKLIEFSTARNVTITAYSPLGRPSSSNGKKLAIFDPKVLELAKKYNKTPAQIILRYTIQNGAIVIPKSTNKNRMKENFNIFDFELSNSDMQFMHQLNNNYRLFEYSSEKNHKYYPFNIEF
ncbi:1,5-anhydro-D-fructose reductase-like isoform X2 [Contarinia nasturtii]|uniref:1,5-anhydro-D-fructose reductase-like isoform X2 n=1 Tax=Contarinia nasturtii TaxID=265458 RepID=UPI0012D3BB77|nr:1,5-anhydro-D-fructose reductase-like isoform X2 [Contarinia nasturtii]